MAQQEEPMPQQTTLYDHPQMLKLQSRSELSLSSPIIPPEHEPVVETLLRSKISVYMCSQPVSRLTPILDSKLKQQRKTTKTSKLFTSSLDMPRVPHLQVLVNKQKEIHHIYRQKIQANFEQCFLFYMDILCAAIKYEYQISHVEIDRDASLLIDCLIYVASTLVEIGAADKLAFYFCVKGIRLCQIYGRVREIGELLYLMGCVMRKMQRFEDCVIFLKKALEYIWRNRSPETDEKQIEIYNLISQCLLQTNQPEHSKIFAYKYEIGYLERSNSKIIELSHQLIDSVQHRKGKWHSVTRESMELLLQFDIQRFVQNYAGALVRLDQKKIVDLMKINFQFLYEGFKADDMFFYEIPLPLEIVAGTKKTTKKKFNQTKFLIKTRSSSMGTLRSKTPVKLLKNQHEKPKEFIIFNYRGIGVSKEKLCSLFAGLAKKIKLKFNMS